MEAITIVIGNGIGMALDSQYFTLETGAKKVWETFSDEERKIINLDSSIDEPPYKENELEEHHLIFNAIKQLKEKTTEINWLSLEGIKFSEIYKKFIFKLAKHFFYFNDLAGNNRYDNFTKRLTEFITGGFTQNSRCHIATLNYDKLLYKALWDAQLLKGYKNIGLVDGLLDSGFERNNLERTSSYNFGWYLHLHGSPLFYTNKNNIIFKNSIDDQLIESEEYKRNHIVLASPKHKPSIIANSELLSVYFEFFNLALRESNQVIVFGYGGNDFHVNAAIKNWVNFKIKNNEKISLQVIECGNKACQERDIFWRERLVGQIDGVDFVLELLPNILDFNFSSK